MDHRKITALTGFTNSDYYEKVGAFAGSPSGFGVAVLVSSRGLGPYNLPADPTHSLVPHISNYEPGVGGWFLYSESSLGGDVELKVGWQNDNGLATAVTRLSDASPSDANLALSEYFYLVHVFVNVATGASPGFLLAINGNLVAFTDPTEGYVPASASNPFKVGQLTLDAPIGDIASDNALVSGWGFISTPPNTPADPLQNSKDISEFISRHWCACLQAGDMVDDPLFSNLYSGRRQLTLPQPTWEPSQGAIALDRVGAEELSTRAQQERWVSGGRLATTFNIP